MNHGEFGRKCSEGLLGHIKSHFETHVQVKLNQVPNEEKPQNIFETIAYTGSMICFGYFLRDDEAPWCLKKNPYK